MVKLKKGLCILLASALMLSCVACGTDKKETSETGNTKAYVEEVEKQELETALTDQLSFDQVSEAQKEETVYVKTDANGNVDSIKVSNWLKNVDGTDGINDASSLSDIENVKGDEQYVDNGDGTITWKADGSDIYYQGTSTKELPVNVKVSYKLDGKDISPEELAHKSGKVTIRFDYENTTKQTVKVDGEDKEVVTPFIMLSGAMLPVDTFSNVQVTNGKVVSEGNNMVVLGYAVPGLKECLENGIDDETSADTISHLDVPEYVEITADATDFTLSMTMSVAVTDMLSTDGITDAIDLSDITDKVDTLGSSADKLENGSKTLSDGVDSLKEGTTKLKDGSATLSKGSSDMEKYTGQLADGTQKIYKSVGTLKTSLNTVKTSSKQLKDGASTLYSGTQTLDKGVGDLVKGEATIDAGFDQLLAGYNGDDKTVGAVKGAENLANGASSVSSGVDALIKGVSAIPASISAQVSDIYKKLAGYGINVSSTDEIYAYMTAMEADGVSAEELPTYKALSQAYYSASTLNSVSASLTQSLQGMQEDMTALSQGAKAVSDGASSLSTGVTNLYNGTKQLSDGFDTLVTGTNTLKTGSGNLKTGAKTLSDGMTELYKGSIKLSNGGNTLYDAMGTLNTSAGSIAKGAKTLNNGVSTLTNGINSLDEGASKLQSGSVELSDGMSQFNEQGIKQITNLLSDSYQSDINFIEALFGQENKYTSYSGSLEGVTTNVKFIYETGAIE